MVELESKVLKTYKIKYTDYFVEIEETIEDNKKWIDVWLCKGNYGIKMYMFGIEKTKNYLDIIDKNVADYITIYDREYGV